MSASVTDKITDIRNAARPNSARVSSGRSGGGTTLACDNLAGWPTASKVHFVTYTIDSSSNPVAGTQLDCTGIVSGNTIGSFTVIDGTDTGNAVNDVVEMLPTAAWGQDLADALTSQHSRTGAHKSVTNTGGMTTDTLTTTGNATIGGTLGITGVLTPTGGFPNNTITAAELATNAIALGYASITTEFDTTSATPTQVTGLTATVTIPAGGRKVKITCSGDSLANDTSGSASIVSIWDGVVNSGTQLAKQTVVSPSSNNQYPFNVVAIVTPAAGSKTYNIGLVIGTSGTAKLVAGATSPAFILVETI